MELNKYRLLRFLNQFTNIHKEGNKKNIFIFSTPRSGSTWLNNLFATQKGIKYCNEPLNLRNDKIRSISKINSWDELYDKDLKQKLIPYFKDFCSGKIKWFNPHPIRKNYHLFTERIVFKIINGAEYFINDIKNECNGKVIYLLRHPIPVSLSRNKLPRLEVLTSQKVIDNFPVSMQKMTKSIIEKGDFMDKAVLSWCIQNKIALDQDHNDWLIICYEQLVIDPLPIINEIKKEFELDNTKKFIEQLDIPSKVTIQSSEGTKELITNKSNNSNDFIERWRSKVSKQKEKELFDIVDCFGLSDIYNVGSTYPTERYLIK